MPQPTITLITRPGAAGQHWVDELQQAGMPAQWWPAFEIKLNAPVQAQQARQEFRQLSSYDCVVFVSPMAVTAAMPLLQAPWPETVAIAAVGEATVRAVRQTLQPSARAPIIAPAAQEDASGSAAAGSEALWPALSAYAPRRVLIARAQQGRDWLAEQLKAQGAQVTTVAVYERMAQPLNAAQCAQLLRWRDEGTRIVTVYSSSEAVDVVLEDAPSEDQKQAVVQTLRSSQAVATHPRIAERLQQRGVTQVQTLLPAVSTLIDYLQTLKSSPT